MTKQIRIENADTSNYKVVVQAWEKGRDLGDGNVEPDTMVSESHLDYAAALISLYICSSRYLVVKEAS